MIPQLAGQIYAMAGMRTELNLAASRPGTFRGQNTQYNGAGFARQKFDVIALQPADYQRWLAQVRAAARPLDEAAYAQLMRKSIPAQPHYFSPVPDELFGHILVESTEPTS